MNPAEPEKPRKVEEEGKYPHYEPFYRASSFAHPVMPTKKYNPPEKCHYVTRATIMKHPPLAPAAIPGDYPRGFSDETIQYVADLRKRIMPFIKFDTPSNPPKEVEYNVGGFQRPEIKVDIPLEFLPRDPERVKKQEEAQAQSEAAERAVKAAQSFLFEAESKITQAEAKTKIVQAEAKLSAEAAEADSQASALAAEAVETVAKARPPLTEATQAKEAAAQAAQASGYLKASEFAEAAARWVEELRSRCAGVETRAKNLQSEVEKRRALREAAERARKALQAAELARKAAELELAREADGAERRVGEMEEVTEVEMVEMVEAVSRSIADSVRTVESKAHEAQQTWERERQAAQIAGNKEADNAVSQAQSAVERERDTQSSVQEREDSMKKGCGACCVIM